MTTIDDFHRPYFVRGIPARGVGPRSGTRDVPARGVTPRSGAHDVPARGVASRSGVRDVSAHGVASRSGVPDVPASGVASRSGVRDVPAHGVGPRSRVPDVPASGVAPRSGVPDVPARGVTPRSGVPDIPTRRAAPRSSARHADEFTPRHNIRVDTTFWQHRSIFAGNQEQLDQLRRDADARAAARARAAFAEYFRTPQRTNPRRSTFDVHRPAIRRLTPIVMVSLLPMLWAITTCHCGDRWPCNDAKQHLRRRHGWTVDITDELKAITRQLPRPRTRLTFLRRLVTRCRRKKPSDGPMSSTTEHRHNGYNGRKPT